MNTLRLEMCALLFHSHSALLGFFLLNDLLHFNLLHESYTVGKSLKRASFAPSRLHSRFSLIRTPCTFDTATNRQTAKLRKHTRTHNKISYKAKIAKTIKKF